jgi:hypothetical protein
MMIRNLWLCVPIVAMLGFTPVSRADDLEVISPEVTQLYAKHLSDLFEKENADRQIKFEIDADQATGVHAGQDGLIVVPVKGLKEDAPDPAVETEKGGGLCYLFLSTCYIPLVDGKPIDAKKLHHIKYTNGEGEVRETVCLLISVKHVEGDDWRLLAFGTEKTPVIDARISEGADSTDKPLEFRVRDVKDQKANLVFQLFSKYSASFAIAHK